MRRRRALGALGSITASAVLVAGASASFPGGNGKVAFVRYNETNDQLDLFVANPDGTSETNLTADFNGNVWSGEWSPDGTKIAFMQGVMEPDDHDFPSRWRLFVMNSDGSAKTRLTSFSAFLPEAVWSPDGSVIAFPRLDRASMQLYAIRPDGSGVVRLTRFRSMLAVQPSWSPDGSQIAFAGFNFLREEQPQIYVVNADGSGLRRLTRTGDNLSPDWSPDGSMLVFEGPRGISTMNRDGTAARLILRNPGYDAGPQWSPDGTKIVFASTRWDDHRQAVGVANADGTCPTRVIASEAYGPDWQPIPGGPASTPLRCADLAVRARVDTRFGLVGEPFTLSIWVENRGNEPAADSRVTVPLRRYLSVASARSSQGPCSLARPVRCPLETLAPGAGARIELVLRPRSPAFAEVGGISAATTADDPDPSTNRASASLWICSRRGTAASETLRGTGRFDVLCAFGGDDEIYAGGGPDRVFAGDGDDQVWGGPGDDYLAVAQGRDVVVAGKGRDSVWAGRGRDAVEGNAGDDQLDGGWGHDVVRGGGGNDYVSDGGGRDHLFGDGGRDHFETYDRSRDVIDGGAGHDVATVARRDVVRRVEEVIGERPGRLTGVFARDR